MLSRTFLDIRGRSLPIRAFFQSWWRFGLGHLQLLTRLRWFSLRGPIQLRHCSATNGRGGSIWRPAQIVGSDILGRRRAGQLGFSLGYTEGSGLPVGGMV